MPKMRLKQDVIIPAGTIFEFGPDKVVFHDGNYSSTLSLTDNTSGEVMYSMDKDVELNEWFEEIDDGNTA